MNLANPVMGSASSASGDGPVVGEEMRCKRFPPGGGVQVPISSRAAARAAISMYAASRGRALAYQRMIDMLVVRLGPSMIPGRAHVWNPPMDRGVWRTVLREWSEVVGEVDEISVHLRMQRGRPGFSVVLLRGGVAVGFAKLNERGHEGLAREGSALECLAKATVSAFRAPRLLARGCVEDWRYLVMSPLTARVHIPARTADIRAIAADVDRSLGGLERPVGTPSHWRPMHGELAPWNLRDLGGAIPVLYDWEGAGWGPPYADEVHYRVARSAVMGRGITDFYEAHLEEARLYWLDLIQVPPHADSREKKLVAALRKALTVE